jgi:hypothetical protein
MVGDISAGQSVSWQNKLPEGDVRSHRRQTCFTAIPQLSVVDQTMRRAVMQCRMALRISRRAILAYITAFLGNCQITNNQ